MNYQSRQKRVKLVEWWISKDAVAEEPDFVATENAINRACAAIEDEHGTILSIKIFDEVNPSKSPSAAIVYEL